MPFLLFLLHFSFFHFLKSFPSTFSLFPATTHRAHHHTVGQQRPPRTKAEKLTAAQKRKEQGNTLIKEPDYENAAMRYVQGLGYLEIVHDLTKEEEEQVKTLKVSLLSNLCLCYLKLNKFNKVIENSTKVFSSLLFFCL